MAPLTTNYDEIQHDEIEALRSIYMEEFHEEKAKVGAWNKSSDRAFSITLKPSTGEHDELTLTLFTSLPSTYPKTLPQLSLSFSEEVRAATRAEAEQVLKTKPEALLGSEMIFEITTSLQDSLDQAAQRSDRSAPTLEEERAKQHAAALQQAQEVQEKQQKEQDQASIEEEQYLEEMVSRQKAREEKQREKLQAASSHDLNASLIRDSTHFDQPATLKDPQGNELVTDAVHGRIMIREGPVTKVWLVRHVGSSEESDFFLVLKECHIPGPFDEANVKKHIQSLEAKLEELTHIPAHPNIVRPLAFKIARADILETSKDQGWTISVLIEKAGRGSLYDVLEMTGSLDPTAGRAWAIQLLEGLGHYHRRGVVHANIHSNNVLLEKIETGRVVAKLSDGGYQRDLHLLKGHNSSRYSGSPSIAWTAPELLNDSADSAGPATDIWMLGIVLIQMFFGLEVRSSHQSPAAFIDSIGLSPSFERLLRAIFQYESKKRPSAWELVSYAFFRNDDPLFEDAEAGSPSLRRSQRRGSTHDRLSNSRFATEFVQEGRLGKGGYGSVVKVRNRLDSNFYAVKIINKCTEAALDKVLNEVRLLSQLNHPYVVRYYTAWKEVDRSTMNGHGGDSSDETESSDESLDVSDVVFPSRSAGLDFIASNNDNVFSDDESSEAETEQDENDGIVFGEDDDEMSQKLPPRCDEVVEQIPATQARRQSSSLNEAVHNTLYIQMEYCEKQTLRDVIKSGIQRNVEEAWRYFRQILQGLTHIHGASIVHRDLKPENIFIDSNSNVRIGDFGLARPGEFLQLPCKGNSTFKDSTGAYGNFTRSVGTTFYVAPEVKSSSAAQGNYDEKADMFSLGVIFFEMNYRLETGMERIHTLGALCKAESTFPAAFSKDPEKAKQRGIILSLVSHDPTTRPSSSDLLLGGLVPAQTEEEMVQAAMRSIAHPNSELRGILIRRIFDDARMSASLTDDVPSLDTDALLEDYMFDFHEFASPEVSESLLRKEVKDHLTSIFRRHGALEVERPPLFPFSAHYSQQADTVYPLITRDCAVLQKPLDLTLPYARTLSKYRSPGPKTYTFGDVFRSVQSGRHPRVLGEVDFDIVSYNSLDLALREAEVIKVLDEIVDEFPSMAAVQMCYHINHSLILDAVLETCDIRPSKRAAVKEVISRLHTGENTWASIRSELRNSPVSVPATSLEELITFDFRDTCDKAISRLRSKFRVTANLESTFAHLQAIVVYLGRLNVKRKVYVNPLGSYNEKFYRGNFLFQCVYDSKKKNVFAAGGRYDHLIKEFQLLQNTSTVTGQRAHGPRVKDSDNSNCHAVGFNLSWQDLHRSMVRYHKGSSKGSSKTKKNHDTNNAWSQVRRCDVLVDSFDEDLLRTSGLNVIQELWAQGIHAELAVSEGSDSDHKAPNAYTVDHDVLPYLYHVHIKQEGFVKVRNIVMNEEIEMRTSELSSWFKSEMMHRDRAEDHGRKLLRYHSHLEQGAPSVEASSNVQVMMSQTKGKKANRRAIIEEALGRCQEFMHGLTEGNVPVTAIETKDDIFERIRETRLGDADSWKKFIQHAPAGDRAYFQDVHEHLKNQAAKAKAGYRSAFLYNFRTGSCIWYDLGHST